MKEFLFAVLIILFSLGVLPALAQVQIPAAACSGSQTFPRGSEPTSLSAPIMLKNGMIKIDLPPSAASKLEAYIYAQGITLAPRGWQCGYHMDGGYGYGVSVTSNGGGYGIGENYTGTDGYNQASEEVSEWADTYFPKIIEQLSPNTVIQIDNGHNWTQNGAYAFEKNKTDRIKYLSNLELVFATPAHSLGVGSQFFRGAPESDPQLVAQDFQINGLISLSIGLLGGEPGLCHLVIYYMALPPALYDLEPLILKNAESQPDIKPSMNSTSC